MGYYTNYELTAEICPGNTDPESLAEAVAQIDGGIFDQWSYDTWTCNAKWYSQEEDMWHLSKQFPDVMFVLFGDGEDGDDQWREYWQNGSMQHCHAEIPPYDPAKMRSCYLDDHGQLRWQEPEEPCIQADLKSVL